MNPIENLYTVFSNYNTLGIHHCNCGCLNETIVKQLYTQELRQIDKDTLAYYHGSALYTWGDLQHYKYYLPRVCELIYKAQNNFYIGINELSIKLLYANWQNWAQDEIKAIEDFVLFNWNYYLHNIDENINLDDFTAYIQLLNIDKFLLTFLENSSDLSTKKLVNFLYDEGQNILHKSFKINEINYQHSFIDFLGKGVLHSLLESSFFAQADINKDYAEKISIVLQMIEQLHIKKL